jgi:hypothetical protein
MTTAIRKSITTEKDERAAWIQRRRENHNKALEVLAYQVNCTTPGLALWRKLRRVENWFTVYSTRYCNGDLDSEAFETVKQQAYVRLSKAFGGTLPQGVFINSDPRGYALKLDNAQVSIPRGMDTDWGGYGILAADID